jgi:hypothetical protein
MSIPVFNPGRAITWVVDFDGTLTKHDTLDTLVDIAVTSKPDKPISVAWEYATKSYLADYSAALKEHAPDGKLPTTIIGERKLLKDLRAVEKKSIERVSSSEIFKDLTAAQLKSGAAKAIESGEVEMRAGSKEFVRYIWTRIDQQNLDFDLLNILSVNWSQRFISRCLQAAKFDLGTWLPMLGDALLGGSNKQYGLSKNKQLQKQLAIRFREAEDAALYRIPIYSNEIEGLERGNKSTGKICAQGSHEIISSFDKLKYLQNMRHLNPYTMKPIPIVYVGDSWTDFECLLAAELGICIRDEPKTSSQKALEDSLNRLDIYCPHISDWEDIDEWGIVWAKDFVEIKQWAEEIESQETE